MTATSVIDKLIAKQEQDYVDFTARAFHELAAVARLRKIVLRDLKAEIDTEIQAYAEQAVKTALEKVKWAVVEAYQSKLNLGLTFTTSDVLAVLDNIISESSKDNQR